MPRALNAPPFPETPGNWLAAYRYRGLGDGTRSSAEHLARLLGVSGATIRRWEGDRLRPTQRDLLRFADVCSLTPVEREFLLRAFGTVDHEMAPDDEAFEMLAEQTLRSVVPTFVMDSLFYMRLWNSYMPVLAGTSGQASSRPHALRSLFRHNRFGRRSMNEDDPVRRWMRSFWFSSAGLIGTESYRAILSDLRQYRDFEERWWDLALRRDSAVDPINLPTVYEHPEYGQFYVLMTTVILPPTYLIRHYLPADQRARDFLIRMRDAGPMELRRDEHSHWSEDT